MVETVCANALFMHPFKIKVIVCSQSVTIIIIRLKILHLYNLKSNATNFAC